MPTSKEADAGQDQIPVEDKVAPNKPKPSQNPTEKKEGGCAKERYPGREKGHHLGTERIGKRGCDSTRNSIECYPTRTRTDQEVDHTHWGCA
jgi:hypothetical protein